MLIDKEIVLDVTQGHPVENVRFHQGDENSIRLKITLTDKNEILMVSGCTVLYNATINGYLVESEARGYTDGSSIYVPVTTNMTALSGQLNIEIKIVETDENDTQQILYTRNLIAFVERSIIEGDLMIDFSGLTIVDIIKSKLDDAPGVITSSHLKDSSVTASKIASNAVSSAKIASGAVTSAKLGSSSVTSSKIATNAVTTDKILNGSVNRAKLATEVINEIAGKIDYVYLGTIASWEDIDKITLKAGVLYHIDTFVGDMASTIGYGNCLGFSNKSGADLFIVNANSGYWYLLEPDFHALSLLSDYPKAENILITDAGQNYYTSTVESALLEIAQRIGRKADYESGEIVSDNIAWYSNNSECIIQGTYQLTGDYCTLTATATLIDGWGVIFYSLPVACVSGVASTIAVGKAKYIVSTTTLSNISTIEIKRLDGALHSVADDSTISFTITYKYR